MDCEFLLALVTTAATQKARTTHLVKVFSQLIHFPFILIGIVLVVPEPSGAQFVVPGLRSSDAQASLKGRVLIDELNCVACHQADALKASSRKSPRLTDVGARVNAAYIRDFIAAPHQIKPGTAMPDLLTGFDRGEKAKIAESITHYLVSLNSGDQFAVQVPDAVAAEQGQKLFHSVGCVACHSPRDADGTESLLSTSIPLGDLDQKYSFKSLRDFLRRPHVSRPSGRMPDLRLPGNEIDRISHYLLRKTVVPGHLAFTTWRGKVWEGLDGDVQKEKAGQVDSFSLEHFGKVPHHTAIRFSGFLNIEEAGSYTFHLQMNGGLLRLNGEAVIEESPSDRRGPKKFKQSTTLSMGWNQIELTYFHTGRKPLFSLEMEGAGFPRQSVPPSMLATSDKPIAKHEPLKVNPKLAGEGKMHFERLGCAQCHDDISAPPKNYPAMIDLNPTKGCLSEDSSSPRFNLDEDQKSLIGAVLPNVETETFTDIQLVNKTLVAFNCIACHDREGLGGVSPERDVYFTGTREALGNQGRVPPPLTHVGAKLTKEWLTEVLLHGGRQREYLNTRMPVFGESNVGHLVERFGKVDSLEKVTLPEIANIRESKVAGYEMMGSTGFSCIACHDFNGQRSGGAGALDLVHVTDRVQKNWFHLYMRQPSRFHNTVIMPSYWPGGQSVRKEVLGGDTNLQIEALWAYLADGTRAKNPKGLSRQSLELRVADETVMCRGRGTAGYRGIGVGYPERISLAFDSEEMALRLLWKGDFASINHGSFRARGRDRISFPAGIPFHRLASMDDSWPYKGKTNYQFPHDQGYQYKGYSLDKQKRPKFTYRYGDVVVEDFFEDRLDDKGEAFFRRTMTFKAPRDQSSFFFRAASGKKITRAGDLWKIDRLNLRLIDTPSAQVREGDPMELLVPLELAKGETTIQLEYQW